MQRHALLQPIAAKATRCLPDTPRLARLSRCSPATGTNGALRERWRQLCEPGPHDRAHKGLRTNMPATLTELNRANTHAWACSPPAASAASSTGPAPLASVQICCWIFLKVCGFGAALPAASAVGRQANFAGKSAAEGQRQHRHASSQGLHPALAAGWLNKPWPAGQPHSADSAPWRVPLLGASQDPAC